MAQGKSKKTGSLKKGLAVESWVKDYLTERKLKFIEQNYHSRYGEIDLIFLDKQTKPNCLVLVEVRYRSINQFGSGAETVSYFKQQKLIKTAQIYLQNSPKYSHLAARFDVVSVTTKGDKLTAEWYQDAFQASAW